jgi:glycosyltransferase involved in cell wall biosynthesis
VAAQVESRVSHPPISVIICTYTEKRLKDIHAAVESILAQTLKPLEVIVAVDHNDELCRTLKASLPTGVIVVMSEEPRGSSGTRNCGVKAASGDYLVCADDDVVAEPDWLENLMAPLSDERVAAVGGRAIPLWPDGKAPAWFPEEFDFVLGCTDHKKLVIKPNGEIRNITSCNAALRKEVFQKVGYWESRLGRCETWSKTFDPIGGEEAEFCLRLKSLLPDRMIVYRPEALVHHRVTPERAKPKYMFNFLLREGVTRARIRGIVSQYGHQPLAAEGTFLRQILFRSIPRRLKTFYKRGSLSQIAVIAINLGLMGTGYIMGRWKYRGGTG